MTIGMGLTEPFSLEEPRWIVPSRIPGGWRCPYRSRSEVVSLRGNSDSLGVEGCLPTRGFIDWRKSLPLLPLEAVP